MGGAAAGNVGGMGLQGLKDGLWWKTVSLELSIAFDIFFVLQDAYVCFNFDFNFLE